MAAGGWKIFTAGDVLTADDTMDYLQQGVLVFDSSGARGSAIASPVEGQFSYLKDTDATEYYDGAAWTPVAQGGLVHIVTESFSAVSSVSLDNCFSGDYDNYRVLVTGASSAVAVMQIRMRVAGSDNTTASSYVSQRTISNSTTVSGARQTQDYLYSCIWSGNDYNQMALDVSRPYLSAPTLFTGLVVNGQGAPDALVLAAGHNQSSSYDGLTIYPSSGTITGTVSVYGYKS